MTDARDFEPLIKSFARRFRDIEDAEQEAWLCYCEAYHDYDAARGVYFPVYLKRKLRWHFQKLLRQKQKQQLAKAAVQHCHHTATHRAPSEQLHSSELHRLPPRTRQAAELILAGYNLSQAAAIMRVTPQCVRNLLSCHRAKYTAKNS